MFVNGVESHFRINLGVYTSVEGKSGSFLVYILNDIVSATKYFSTSLYADDTLITVTGKD